MHLNEVLKAVEIAMVQRVAQRVQGDAINGDYFLVD